MAYTVPSVYLKQYTPKEIHDLKRSFKAFDLDGNGFIDEKELGDVLLQIGEKPTTLTLHKMIAEVDTNQDGQIEFSEFLTLLSSLRTTSSSTNTNQPSSFKPPPPPPISGSDVPTRKSSFASSPNSSTVYDRSSSSGFSGFSPDVGSLRSTVSNMSRVSISGVASGIPHLAQVVQKQQQIHETWSGGVHSVSDVYYYIYLIEINLFLF